MKKSISTIKGQISKGFRIVILIMLAIVIASSIMLVFIWTNYVKANDYQNNRMATQEAISAHYDWLQSLSTAVQSGSEFKGNLDYNTCSLGKWKATVTQVDLADPIIANALAQADKPHQLIHSTAAEILALSKTDHDAAYQQYINTIFPAANTVIANLKVLTGRYKEIADVSAKNLEELIIAAIISGIILAVVGIAFALVYAGKVAKKISKPITAVAGWSEQLSMGSNELDFDALGVEASAESEIGIMVNAFRHMAKNIKENVEVVSRVADGDMTAYVSIRSAKDSLGKNLYRMVQTNDLLFSNILNVAQTVASGAQQIASASQALSDSSSEQAQAVAQLSDTIDNANELINLNSKKAVEANNVTKLITEDSRVSGEKLNTLVGAVDAILEASEKVSAVIKSIDDIAFQTNILALNASIEAARAGAAGKGFAVVADEVRNLALKSGEAVTNSKKLIESTIERARAGYEVSKEASDSFTRISDDVGRIVSIISEISESSDLQLKGIGMVRSEIVSIARSADGNAAISEEAAASSAEMNVNADRLRDAMSKFNLRQRQQGTPYIPPEKQNDTAFVQSATKNYEHYMQTGKPALNAIDSIEAGNAS